MRLLYSAYIKNPKNVCFDGEDNGEEVLLILRKHVITNLSWISISVLLFNMPEIMFFVFKLNGFSSWEVIPVSFRLILGMFWYAFSFGFVFVSFLTWYFSVNIVSTKRVVDIDFFGFINRRFSEALLTNIQDLTHEISGVAETIFNYGTLHIQTAGEKQEIEFEDIPRPSLAQDFISDLTRGVKADGVPDIKETNK
uniref:DUF304 domain-containing protein n=1 Tax=candidate division WWE3 bacterium TaxID=2053526 RepID=A0A7C4TQ03_UNCKA